MDSAFDLFTGHLPKPIIWAEPGSVIAQYSPVIIWCQGSWEAEEYCLYKERSRDPWDTQFPLKTRNISNFNIQYMTIDYAGIYKCYYWSSAGFSEHSDAMELVVTGEWTFWEPCTCFLLRRRSTRSSSLRVQSWRKMWVAHVHFTYCPLYPRSI